MDCISKAFRHPVAAAQTIIQPMPDLSIHPRRRHGNCILQGRPCTDHQEGRGTSPLQPIFPSQAPGGRQIPIPFRSYQPNFFQSFNSHVRFISQIPTVSNPGECRHTAATGAHSVPGMLRHRTKASSSSLLLRQSLRADTKGYSWQPRRDTSPQVSVLRPGCPCRL